MSYLPLFVSCKWLEKIWLIESDIVMIVCCKLLISMIIFFIFRVMWLIPNMMFVSHAFILLEKRVIFATIQCSSWLIVKEN